LAVERSFHQEKSGKRSDQWIRWSRGHWCGGSSGKASSLLSGLQSLPSSSLKRKVQVSVLFIRKCERLEISKFASEMKLSSVRFWHQIKYFC